MIEHQKQAGEIDLAEQQTNRRHNDSFDQRGDDFAKGRADNYTDGEVDNIGASDEFLEFFQHGFSFFGANCYFKLGVLVSISSVSRWILCVTVVHASCEYFPHGGTENPPRHKESLGLTFAHLGAVAFLREDDASRTDPEPQRKTAK